MAGKIRVYELARELGLTNKETLDLCDALGIGVKSHSSSVVEAQADRVRRKAQREGLIRDEQPEEPKKEPAKKKAAPKKAAAKRTAPKKAAAPTENAAPEPQAAAEPEAPAEPEQEAAPAPSESPAPSAEPPAAEPTAPDPAAPASPQPSRRFVTSSGSTAPPRREAPVAPAALSAPPRPSAAPSRPATPEAPAARATPPEAAPAAAPQTPPNSPSGKPIPPPPTPRSGSGKAIPPPPGLGGRGPAPAPPGRGRPGGGFGRPMGGAGRPSAPPMGGGPRPGGGPGGGPGGRPGGGPGGRPGGGPGGRPGGPAGRRPPRRKSRRRRSLEELQPMDMPSYTPADAAVPEGEIVIERSTTPLDLGPRLNRTAADVVRFLLQQGEMVTATQSLSDDMIELFAADVGAEIRLVNPGEEQEVELQKQLNAEELDDPEHNAPARPPVITVMGHVDHGKTKLLDRIRKTNVVAGEAGGITQHIGAYQVERNGKPITFVDTPGHAAFTAMRARGADVTDIVILVVAADDGVMPQTLEAIQHARAAEVPIVVAVNKIDRDNADPQRVLSQLSENGLVPESWGGDTIVCEISALQDIGIDELLDNVLVLAELEDLRGEPDGRARGAVLEANLDVGRGPVATVIVERGTLRIGDPMVAGAAWGRVRALIDDRGENVKEAGPSAPVQVLGLSDVAVAGDEFIVAPDDKTARSVAEAREHWRRQTQISGTAAAATGGGARLEDIFQQIQAGETATLNLIVKADVNGSLEAVTESLKKLERDEVRLSFVLRGVGGITESDIQLAATSHATIIGFNVRPDRKARELAEAEQVEIRTYEIIYNLLDDVQNAMLGLLAPQFEEVVTGDAEVREIFRVPRIGAIAGCLVQNGVITRNSKVRFLREGTIIWKGTVSSLKRFKDDATEVRAGFECGIGLSDFQDLKPGDVIETFDEREIPRT
ncbi:MAG: translation initiation factor IF-2 [Acidimicrobiales bacterium]